MHRKKFRENIPFYLRIAGMIITRFGLTAVFFLLVIFSVELFFKMYPSISWKKPANNSFTLKWLSTDFREIYDSDRDSFFHINDKKSRYFFPSADSTKMLDLAYFRSDSNRVSIGVFSLSEILEFNLINKGRNNNDIWILNSVRITLFSETSETGQTTKIPTYYWVISNLPDSVHENENNRNKNLCIRLKQDFKISNTEYNRVLSSGSSVAFRIERSLSAKNTKEKLSYGDKP